MRLRKLFILTAALLAIPAAAVAQTYTPVQSASITLNQTTVARGSSLTATVVGGTTGSQRFVGTVTWFVNSTRTQVGSSTASNGGASLTFVVPSTLETGAHTVEASGTSEAGTALTVTRAFTVSGGTSLARTGASNTGDLVRLGGALLIVGAVLVYGVRRRVARAH
jgi:hypothetical protein